MRMRLVAIFGLLALVVGAACASFTAGPAVLREGAGGAADTASAPGPAPTMAPAALPKPAAARTNAGAAPAPPAAPQSAEAAQAQNLPGLDRMIIRTVTMTISVANVQEAYQRAERIAVEQGGLIAGSQIRQDGDRTTANLTLRVPADPATYQTTLDRLRGIAEKVVEEQAQAQDITEEHVDLESRLRNLRATEDSLIALLGRAQRIEDIIQIQRELTNVRGQIEQIQGRKQALERRADMATINLQIREQAAFARGGWNPGETAGEAIRSLTEALRGLAIVLIWAVVWLPLWGGALLALWLLRRVWRPTFRRPAPAGGATPTAGGA
jgi:hypothetical protein